MKRLVMALAAAAVVGAPLALAATDANAQGRGNDRREWRDDRGGRWDNRGPDRRWDNDRGRYDNRRWDNDRRRDNNRGRDFRWDDRRWNGYYLGSRWYYGPPPAVYYNRRDFRPDYRPWQRGMYLPPAYRSYVVYDYGRYRLRPPPRGYHWVRHNNDYILAAIATGLILDVITNW